MAFVLDTNVVSEFRKVQAGKGAAGVAEWAASVARSDLYLSAITVMELEMGVRMMERRDVAQGVLLRRWITRVVLPEFDARILAFDADVALRAAALHVPDPKPWRDTAIAATAMVHGMTVVTRNTSDFKPTGVALFDPWGNR